MKKTIVMMVLLMASSSFAAGYQESISGNWCSVGKNGIPGDFTRIISLTKNGDYKTVVAGLSDYDARTKQTGYISAAASRVLTEPAIVGLGKVEDLRLGFNENTFDVDFEAGRISFVRCPKKWSDRVDQIFK